MKALWCLPSIDREWRRECLAGLRAQHVMVVDNAAPNRNLGVTAPWNLGRAAVLALGFDYLVVVSEACRFGAAGGLDFEQHLDGSAIVLSHCVGFHLVAIAAATLTAVGEFDENLPTYGSDRDFLVRLALAGLPAPGYNEQPVPQHQVDVVDAGVAHSIETGLAAVSFADMTRYLVRKWSDPQPGSHYPHPFNDPSRDWRWWPAVSPVGDRSGVADVAEPFG